MPAKPTRWTIAAAGAALIFASGEALAPADPGVALACAGAGPLAAAAIEQASPPDPAQRVLVKYLSRRFAIAAEATERMVQAADRAATEVGLDPLLVLAVISIESRFNPIAESSMGAKGLMQIIPKYHRARLDALGGEDSVLDPESNILLGAQILQEYVRRTGTLEAGLQYYNGAFSDASAQYAQKVMAERERLEQVVRSRGRTS
ncbi:MAG: lytic transglycosylase domain-containing protein [Betaproteobacteria bacterium]|nr:MAG: lytic transglycosylase domain-containing protein [Betaproteobacteria bacterium]